MLEGSDGGALAAIVYARLTRRVPHAVSAAWLDGAPWKAADPPTCRACLGLSCLSGPKAHGSRGRTAEPMAAGQPCDPSGRSLGSLSSLDAVTKVWFGSWWNVLCMCGFVIFPSHINETHLGGDSLMPRPDELALVSVQLSPSHSAPEAGPLCREV